MVTDVENEDVPIIARRHQCLLILTVPAHRLHLALVQPNDLLTLEVVQVPNPDGRILGARGQVLLLDGVEMHAHDSLCVSAEVLRLLLRYCLLLASLIELGH